AAFRDVDAKPHGMEEALFACICKNEDGACTADFRALTPEQLECAQHMSPLAWRAMNDHAQSLGGWGLQALDLGDVLINDNLINGLNELQKLVHLTLRTPPSAE